MFDVQPRVAVRQRAQAMGDHEGRAALHQALHRVHDRSLGVDIDGTGRLVEDEDRGILQEGPRQRDALALPPERHMPRSPTWVS